MNRFFKSILSVLVSLLSSVEEALFSYMARAGLVLTAVQLPNGSVIAIAASYGDVIDLDAVSNANPAVATLSSSHGLSTGDIVEVTSGWSRLTDKILRLSGVAGSNANLEGFNASSTTLFPAGAGVGTVREILTWTNLQQITNSTTNGGEQQFLEYQFLESDAQRRIPTVKSPSGMEITIADDPELAGYILAAEANDDRLPRSVRITLPSGALIFYNAYITLNKIPSLTVNELMAVSVTLSLLSEPTRYTS